jgi:hypothetical protein
MKQIGFVPSEKFARLAVPKSEAIRDSPEIGFVPYGRSLPASRGGSALALVKERSFWLKAER